jgi:mannitol/fructose-specific phosphotransferase system IIA component (Ntr-type)
MRRRLALVRPRPSDDAFAPHPALFLPALEVGSTEALFTRLTNALALDGVVSHASGLLQALIDGEHAGTSALGFGIAVPHARSPAVATTAVACALLRPPLGLGAPDGMPACLVFLVVAPHGITGDQLEKTEAPPAAGALPTRNLPGRPPRAELAADLSQAGRS